MVNLEGAAAAFVAAPSPCAVTIAPARSTGTATAIAINRRFTSDLLDFSRLLFDFSVLVRVFPGSGLFARVRSPDFQFLYNRFLANPLHHRSADRPSP
jgi:hypothetical protein